MLPLGPLPYFPACRGSRAGSCFASDGSHVPVDDDALVLDVGSGDKPSWRADVLLDRYAGAEFAAQRSGRKHARVSRPLFDADAADMPFADGAFDYAICSNLLEHVTDPEGVARELQRVARAGYIEVPGGGERQDRRLPEPPVVVPARRDGPCAPDPGTHGQECPVLRRGDPCLHRPGRRPAVARPGAEQQVRPPGHPVPLVGAVPAAHRGGAVAGLVAEAMTAEGHRRGWEAVIVQASPRS